MADEKRTSDTCYLVCPHCGHKHQDTWDIFDEIEGEIDEFECHRCEKPFIAIKTAIFIYEGVIPDES